MADRYPWEEDYEGGYDWRQREERRYDRGQDYPGGYEGARSGEFDDQRYRSGRESAPGGRYGQGRSSTAYGQQGYERGQQPDRYSQPSDWSRRLREGEWQRQQQWELAGGPSASWMPEERWRQQPYENPWEGSRGGPYGMEYPETGYRSPGGYGEMYRGGEMGRRETYGPDRAYGRYFGRGPKGYQRSDERIREDVCERLTRSWDVDAEDVDVRVRDGEVTLTGSVMDRYQKRMAEEAVEGIPGVRDVHNQLRAGMGESAPRGQLASPTGQYRAAQSTPSRAGTSSRSSTTGKSAPRTTTSARPKGSTSSRSSSTSTRSSGSPPRATTASSRSRGPSVPPAQRTGTATMAEREPRSPDPFQPESRSNQ